jgi:signal transduction protein with GAF and PtsI domain
MNREFAIYKEICRLVSHRLTYKERLEKVVKCAIKETASDAGYLLVFEDKKLVYQPESCGSEEIRQHKMKAEDGLAFIGSCESEPEDDGSVLTSLIKIGDETVGKIEVVRERQKSGFSREESEILSQIAEASALIIGSEQVYKTEIEKMRERMRKLIQIGESLNSTHILSDLLEMSMRTASNVMEAESASLMLKDNITGELVFKVISGKDRDKVKEIRLKPGEGIAGWVANTGKPVIVTDVTKDPRFSGEVDKKVGSLTRSLLAAPLKARDKIIGVIEVINKLSGSFTSDDLEFFCLLGNQVALAIENARLFEFVFGKKQ